MRSADRSQDANLVISFRPEQKLQRSAILYDPDLLHGRQPLPLLCGQSCVGVPTKHEGGCQHLVLPAILRWLCVRRTLRNQRSDQTRGDSSSQYPHQTPPASTRRRKAGSADRRYAAPSVIVSAAEQWLRPETLSCRSRAAQARANNTLDLQLAHDMQSSGPRGFGCVSPFPLPAFSRTFCTAGSSSHCFFCPADMRAPCETDR